VSTGDVRVFGLVTPTHVIEDIAMDVPHGREVVIPADKAARSRDLYKAIGQKCVFKLPDLPPPVHTAPAGHVRDDLLQERNRHLEARNKLLEEEVTQLRASLGAALAQRDQFDAIMKAIGSVKAPFGMVGMGSGQQTPVQCSDVADGSAPQFIPGEIAPKDAEVRIDRVSQEADSGSVSDATAKLRQMRKGGNG